MRIRIIDGNNWFRRRIEQKHIGSPIRLLFNEVHKSIYDKTIIVWDGFNPRKLRKEIYPDYKKTRNKPSDDFFESQKMFKCLCTLSSADTIEIPEMEADDVIAELVNKFKKDGYFIYLESNDADLAQLGVTMGREEFPIEPEWVALYKTLVGDTSDNIKGVPGFGKGAWAKLTLQDKQYLRDYLCCKTTLPRDLPDKIFEFCKTEEGFKTLRNYWLIVNFFPVKWEDIKKYTTPGFNRPDLADEAMKQYFM